MKTLLRSDIPGDFIFYRTGSEVFYEYSRDFYWWKVLRPRDDVFEFYRIDSWFGWLWYTVEAEKIDREPRISDIRNSGAKHGVIFWTPKKNTQKPAWWIALPRWLWRKFPYSSRSAFIELDGSGEYWRKWTSKARNHRKNFLKQQTEKLIHVEQSDDLMLFRDMYKSAHISDPHKRIHLQWLNRVIQTQWMKNKRIYFWYIWDKIVTWALFIDMGTTSEYFMSFYPPESRSYQFGIGLLDRWMQDSLEMGIRYCDLDHMWNIGCPNSQKWYTEFKSWIAEYDVYFEDVWIKFF